MTTDNKTLADVQPGGRVRLGDKAERSRFEAWAEGASLNIARFNDGGYCDERTVSAWLAWLSAQPSPATCKEGLQVQTSPGGQGDALTALVAKWRAAAAEHELISLEADSIGLTVAAMRNDARHHVLEAAADELEAALAARQPVTMDDALAAGDGTLHGAIDHWQERALRAEDELAARQPVGEPVAWMHTDKATGRVKFGLSPMYDCDFNAVQWDSVALYAAPAQAVDLDALRRLSDGWLARSEKLSVTQQRKAGAYWACAKELRDWLDSQAVGK